MAYDAVIFDLFGTLIPNFSTQAYEQMQRRMADILGAPFEGFQRIWGETNDARAKGQFPTLDANIVHACRELGIPAPQAKVDAAVAVRVEMTRVVVRAVRAGAVETLTKLRLAGYKTGLISDCTPEIPALWRTTPLPPLLDVATFSSESGLKKPDPAIYRLTCERLRVQPERCLYVGDGDSRELTGARAVGMTAVRIEALVTDAGPAHVLNAEAWDGRRIARIEQVLEVLAEG